MSIRGHNRVCQSRSAIASLPLNGGSRFKPLCRQIRVDPCRGSRVSNRVLKPHPPFDRRSDAQEFANVRSVLDGVSLVCRQTETQGPAPAGKKIRCPKCEEAFAPADEDAREVDPWDLPDESSMPSHGNDDEEDDNEGYVPARSIKKKPTKRKKSSEPFPTGLVVGGWRWWG